MHFDQSSIERGPRTGSNNEIRTDEEINDTNQKYNEYLYGLKDISDSHKTGGNTIDISETIDSTSSETQSQMQSEALISSDEAPIVNQGFNKVIESVESPESSVGQQLNDQVDDVRGEVYKILSETGIDSVDDSLERRRVVAEQIETSIDGEEVSDTSEFIGHNSRERVVHAATAERVIAAANDGNEESLAYVSQLLEKNTKMRGYLQTAKEAGGVQKLSNDELEEVGRIIRNNEGVATGDSESVSSSDKPRTIDEVLDDSTVKSDTEGDDNKTEQQEDNAGMDYESDLGLMRQHGSMPNIELAADISANRYRDAA